MSRASSPCLRVFAIGLCAAVGSALGFAQGAGFGSLDGFGVERPGTSFQRAGDWLFVGDVDAGPGGDGQLEVYEHSAGSWELRQTLVPPTSSTRFGTVLGADDSCLVVSSYEPSSLTSPVLIFERSGQGAWGLVQTLRAAALGVSELGGDADISGDVLALTARAGCDCYPNDGVVLVFERVAGAWQFERELFPRPWDGASKGTPRTVDVEGDLIVAGAPELQGGAYVFRRTAIGWRRVAYLDDPLAPAYSNFGQMVATNGSDILVGGAGVQHGPGELGGVVVHFARTGPDQWSRVQRMRPGPPSSGSTEDRFWSMDLDGDELVVGAPYSGVPGAPDSGAVYYYRRGAAGWPAFETHRFVPSTPVAGGRVGGRVQLAGGVIMAARNVPRTSTVDAILLFGVEALRFFCANTPNSTGFRARLEALGSDVAAERSLVLRVRNAPPGVTGGFFASQGQLRQPFSNGFLCLAPPQFRTGPLVRTDGGGGAAHFVDVDRLGPAWVAGTTWHFQFWHRDSIGQGVGLSTGTAGVLR